MNRKLIVSFIILLFTLGMMATADVIEVDSIAELRQQATGNDYRITGEVVLTFQQGFRNQKTFQDKDGTAAILIDDDNANITTSYDLYDGITGLTGRLGQHGGLLQLQPQPGDDPGPANTVGNIITPRVVTLQDLKADEVTRGGNPGFDEYEAELIRVLNVEFTEDRDADTFETGELYGLNDGTDDLYFRTHFYDADYIGDAVPEDAVHLTAIPLSHWSDGRFIFSRSWDDFAPTDISPAPTAHAENFTAETVDYRRIQLTWDDPDTEVNPRAYYIKASDVSFEDIDDPVDGVPETANLMIKNVSYGTESVTFDGLGGDTEYYFKIFPYTNTGEDILYLVADAPEASATTDEAPTTLHYWNFNVNVPASDTNWNQPIGANYGIGGGEITYSLTEVWTFTGTTLNADYNDGPGGSLAPRGGSDLVNNGEYIEIAAPTTGHELIRLSYAARRTDTGFTSHQISYSTDGSTFRYLTTISDIPLAFGESSIISVNFGNITAANDNPDFKIRITLNGATFSAGNNRIDNIRISDDGEYVTSVSSQTWTLFE